MNYQISKILVPVDLSETSLNALETCISLANKHNATVIILNIIETHFTKNEENDTFNISISNSKDVLNALIGSIQHEYDLKPLLVQKQGNVYEQIVRMSISEQVDVIVMGSHGASGFRNGFIGSNTYNVMKHAICPVLSIPSKRKFNLFRKALFPIRPVSGALARYEILCHFLASQSIINVLGLSYKKMETDTKVLDKIAGEIIEKVKADKAEIHTAWGNGDGITEDILNYVQQTSNDLIVLTNLLDVTSKNGFIGPHTQKIVNCSKIPVLSIRSIGVPYFA